MLVDVKEGGNGSLYALTACGLLMYVQDASSRTVDKSVSAQVMRQIALTGSGLVQRFSHAG